MSRRQGAALRGAVFTVAVLVVALPPCVSPALNLGRVYSPLLMLLLVAGSLREYEVEEHTTGDIQPRRFEELPNETRVEALNLAWSGVGPEVPFPSPPKLISEITVAASLVGAALLAGFISWTTRSLFTNSPYALTTFDLLGFVSGRLLFDGINRGRIGLYERAVALSRQRFEQRHLRTLAVGWINAHYEGWRANIAAKSIEDALAAFGLTGTPPPCHLLEHPEECPQSDLPPARISLTLLCVGTHLGLRSPIGFDLMGTALQIASGTVPPGPALERASDLEFHYEHIVTVQYVRSPEGAAPGPDGELVLSLVNGERVSYPSSEHGVDSAVHDVRTRVRQGRG